MDNTSIVSAFTSEDKMKKAKQKFDSARDDVESKANKLSEFMKKELEAELNALHNAEKKLEQKLSEIEQGVKYKEFKQGFDTSIQHLQHLFDTMANALKTFENKIRAKQDLSEDQKEIALVNARKKAFQVVFSPEQQQALKTIVISRQSSLLKF